MIAVAARLPAATSPRVVRPIEVEVQHTPPSLTPPEPPAPAPPPPKVETKLAMRTLPDPRDRTLRPEREREK